MSPKPDRAARSTELWRVAVTAPDAEHAAAAADALSTFDAVSCFEERDGGPWHVEALARKKPDAAELTARLSLAWLNVGGDAPPLSIETMPRQDWLGINQGSFPPLAVGRFFIHGSHYAQALPPGRIALLIDAATAFGTGEHATTRGCLAGLASVNGHGGLRILDMGTGTGILAMAAAKLWHGRIEARDIDAESVRVAAHNFRRNAVSGLIHVTRSAGYRERGVIRHSPYDLVLANILARPLEGMARDLGRALAPHGIAILSGLLKGQEPGVLAAHRALRLRLRQRLVIDGWSTLVLSRERPAAFRALRRYP